MKPYSVVFAPEAEDQLVELYEYIARNGAPQVAARYTDAIVTYCEGLADFPHRGTCRDDVRRGLRITNYRRRTVIAFEADDATRTVAVLGVFYGGRNYERVLGSADWDDVSDEE